MSPPSPPKPLASRDANAPKSPPKAASSTDKEVDEKPKSMNYHREALQKKLAEDNSKQVYVSPSDAIMSPGTKKLSDYKNKHFAKAKPQSLFAKMEASKKAESSTNLDSSKKAESSSSLESSKPEEGGKDEDIL